MKHTIIICLSLLAFIGCKKDNKEPPSSTITGQIVYQKQPLSVRSGGVELELWQNGYQLTTKIPVYVKDDGSFSAKVFDGDYKLTLLQNNGPWVSSTDSIDIKVNGSAQVDVNVIPYFMVSGVSYQKNGNTITATINIQEVNTDRSLEAVRLYIGQTVLTDQNFNLVNVSKSSAEIADINEPVVLTADIPAALVTKGYSFVRVGIKTQGVAEMIYSLPEELR